MRVLLHIILTVTIVCGICPSCGSSSSERAFFAGLDSLIDSSPDSARTRLLELQPEVDSLDDISLRMRYELMMAEVQNKLYMQLPSDTAFQEVMRFYDKEGDANDRVRVRYVMGCIYRDRNEAPMALKYYQDAVDAANTTDIKCNFKLLDRIYGQMADIYYNQYLPLKSIEAERKCGLFALKAGDTYGYIKSVEMLSHPYSLLHDTAKVMEVCDSACMLYRQNDMPENAVRVYPILIRLMLGRKEYADARKLMDEFDREINLYGRKGTADPDYAEYLYQKGLYYIALDRHDSAEQCFRRLIPFNQHYKAYNGLQAVYSYKRELDSAFFYNRLKDSCINEELARIHTDAVNQASSMYSYERLYRKTQEAEWEAKKEKLVKWSLIGFIILAASVTIYSVRRIIGKRKKEKEKLYKDYCHTSALLDKTSSELKTLKAAYNALQSSSGKNSEQLSELKLVLNEKDKDIKNLVRFLSDFDSSHAAMFSRQNINQLKGSDILIKISDKLKPEPQKEKKVSEEEWAELIEKVRNCIPIFYYNITKNSSLTNQEKQTAILLLLDYSNKDISILLDTSKSRISNIRSGINLKLFGTHSAHHVENRLKELLTVG